MTLQIGVIGCGAIGQDHIRRLTRTLSGARVVAVNDIDPQQARDAVTKYGLDAEIYADGHEVVAAADVQAVLVTSWGPTHEAFVLDAIAHGKPVFCEKPLAVTAEGACGSSKRKSRTASGWCRSASCVRTTKVIARSSA
ncbi:Inositol 2-dehydrogenase/D-chiro-inositol 3-dehydrogenase [Burkholderia cepacia]|nr:Inositol 2-dehydrogenase/D-chiro-inositol 3-dehydrogenase [Burkholderia cepacia]